MAYHKRLIFLVNKPFQIKFSLIASSIIFLLSSIYPLIMYDFFDIVSSMSSSVPQAIIESRREFLLYLILIQIVVCLLVFLAFIFMTNKVAGPIHKLKNHLQRIREGAPIEPVNFRSGDYFHELAEDVNLFLENTIRNQEKDFHYLDEVANYIENLSLVIPDDKKPVMIEISKKLEQIKSRYDKYAEYADES